MSDATITDLEIEMREAWSDLIYLRVNRSRGQASMRDVVEAENRYIEARRRYKDYERSQRPWWLRWLP